MTSSVAKWGNSLAIRLPRHVVQAAHIQPGTELDIQVQNDQLILKKKKEMTLDELVGQISAANRHNETKTGTAVGREAW